MKLKHNETGQEFLYHKKRGIKFRETGDLVVVPLDRPDYEFAGPSMERMVPPSRAPPSRAPPPPIGSTTLQNELVREKEPVTNHNYKV